jgi:hypothetical protein
MVSKQKQKVTPIFRALLLFVLIAGVVSFFIPDALAAASKVVDVGPIKISPDKLIAGKHPQITVHVAIVPQSKAKSLVVNIVAVITRPDHSIKSWNWKEKITRGSSRLFKIPPEENDTTANGIYRVQIMVYSHDMKRRYTLQSSQFEVLPREQRSLQEPEKRVGAEKGIITEERQREYLGIGIYGNALNPAGGGTIILWPSKYVGVQGLYSTGTFDSYEGRLLFKYDVSSKYSIYGGLGYLHVTADKNVLGTTTRFEDSALSGVVGLEVALAKRVLLYIESSAAGIDLERTVTSGGQTVKATVNYAPVTIGCSLVWTVF